MNKDTLMARAGGVCEFCGSNQGLGAVDVPPAGEIVLCAICSGGEAGADHWRCLEGAAWSDVPAVQLAVWRKLAGLSEPWASEAQSMMALLPEVEGWIAVPAALEHRAPEHRDCNGVMLAQGDNVVLIKDLPVKGAGFTAKRGTVVRSISLAPDNSAHIEGRVEGQRIVILTEFVKKR